MDSGTRAAVRKRAQGHCEYCGLHQDASWLQPFHVEHIIPRKHRGADDLTNLPLACDHCNLRKGSNLSGLDPDTNKLTRLFNPRIDLWKDHFEADGPYIRAKTNVGRTTEWVLRLNAPERVALRRFLSRLEEE
jgi:hypothetical protein